VKKLVLVRHGETNYNQQHRLQGQLDIPLNDTGQRQAERVCLALRSERFSEIWSSPLARSFATAQAINRHHAVNLKSTEFLLERSFGEMEGDPVEEFQRLKANSDLAVQHFRAPGGESLADLKKRAQLLWQQVKEFDGDDLLLVGHAGIFRAFIGVILEWDLERWRTITQLNTCINSFVFDDHGKVSAYQLNEAGHCV
jgi:probable phosphoglycerate mutase